MPAEVKAKEDILAHSIMASVIFNLVVSLLHLEVSCFNVFLYCAHKSDLLVACCRLVSADLLTLLSIRKSHCVL